MPISRQNLHDTGINTVQGLLKINVLSKLFSWKPLDSAGKLVVAGGDNDDRGIDYLRENSAVIAVGDNHLVLCQTPEHLADELFALRFPGTYRCLDGRVALECPDFAEPFFQGSQLLVRVKLLAIVASAEANAPPWQMIMEIFVAD